MSPWGRWDPKVQPFASLPKLVKPDCAILVINREMPRSFSLHRQVRSLKYRLSGKKLRKEASCDRGLAVSGVGCGSDSHGALIHNTFQVRLFWRLWITSFELNMPPVILRQVFLQGECDTSIRWLARELGGTKELDQVRQISKQIIST